MRMKIKNQDEYQPFAGIISKALSSRSSGKGAIDRHPEYCAPVYVVRMCEALLEAMKEVGNQSATLADVVRLESTCTGADYSHKLAMRCQRLVQA